MGPAVEVLEPRDAKQDVFSLSSRDRVSKFPNHSTNHST